MRAQVQNSKLDFPSSISPFYFTQVILGGDGDGISVTPYQSINQSINNSKSSLYIFPYILTPSPPPFFFILDMGGERVSPLPEFNGYGY